MQIAIALAWEFWARGWRGILLGQAGGIALLGLIYGIMQWDGGLSFRGTATGSELQFAFYWFTLVMTGTAVVVALGEPNRRYTLPASSLLLVGIPMACAMATAFATYWTTAVTLNAVFDAGWSIRGPAMLAAVLAAWFHALLWSTANSVILRFVASFSSFMALVLAVNHWFRPAGQATAGFLEDVLDVHILLFAVATIGCVSFGTLGFNSLRHGSGIRFERILATLNWRRWKLGGSVPFRSPRSAQIWLEFADRGFALPVGTAVIGTVWLVVAWFWPPPDAGGFIAGISGFAASLACLVGIFLGLRSEHGGFGNFNGSRPLSDRQMANAVLQSTTRGLLLSAAIWALVLPPVIWLLGDRVENSRLARTIQQLDWPALIARITLGAIAIWSAVSLVTSSALAGKKVMATAFYVPFALALVGQFVPKYFLPPEIRAVFAMSYSYTCLVLAMLLFAAVFAASIRVRVISVQAVLLAASLALLAIGAAHYSSEWPSFLPIPVLCGCVLLSTPLAAAPLAVWYNRHR